MLWLVAMHNKQSTDFFMYDSPHAWCMVQQDKVYRRKVKKWLKEAMVSSSCTITLMMSGWQLTSSCMKGKVVVMKASMNKRS